MSIPGTGARIHACTLACTHHARLHTLKRKAGCQSHPRLRCRSVRSGRHAARVYASGPGAGAQRHLGRAWGKYHISPAPACQCTCAHVLSNTSRHSHTHNLQGYGHPAWPEACLVLLSPGLRFVPQLFIFIFIFIFSWSYFPQLTRVVQLLQCTGHTVVVRDS